MSNIEYLYTEGEREYKKVDIIVRLDGVVSGKIKWTGKGYSYFPKGSKTHGELFDSIQKVQNSLK